MGICCVKDQAEENTENPQPACSIVLVCDESELNSTRTKDYANSLRARSYLYSNIDSETPISSLENVQFKNK